MAKFRNTSKNVVENFGHHIETNQFIYTVNQLSIDWFLHNHNNKKLSLQSFEASQVM